MDAIKGDGLTKAEMKQRNIRVIEGQRGGVELHAPTYRFIIAQILQQRGFLEAEQVEAACDYLELRNCVYGFLNAKTISASIFRDGSSVSSEVAEEMYRVARKELGSKLNERLVIGAMVKYADDTLDMISVCLTYQSAFANIITAMREAIKYAAEKKHVAAE